MSGPNSHISLPVSEERLGLRAIEGLYRTHADWLRGLIARRLRIQPADVDDIVQDTWLRASCCKTGEIQHPKAFLTQTALNLFRDRRRRETVRDDHRSAVAANEAESARQKPGLAEQETAFTLERLILSMPDIHRDVFLLSRFSHMTNAQIAEHLGISIKTVEWRMGKALELCMIALQG